MFGPHLIIDGTRCDTRKLADRNIVEQVLNDYPTAIGMTKIGGPYMFEYQAPDPAYSGVSGIVVIAESHIAIHTFPELDYFTMDIFSCKNFDHEIAIEYITRAFDVKEMDRMLVQRGLSFRGPHHGKLGATDELIAAAQARLDAGVISKEPALPDAPAAVLDQRAAALARHSDEAGAGGEAAGKMIWPQYGVTPDVGTYGSMAGAEAHTGVTVTPLAQPEAAPLATDGHMLPACEPVQVNPTASISGLLDKLVATAGPGRALGRALGGWERLARDPDTTIALALSAPVIADGLREALVYAVERRYVDTIVASADDLFADLYEALGHAHFAGEDGAVATAAGREHTVSFFADFLAGLAPDSVATPSDLWRALGAALPTRVPRKGLLQAAAASGVRIYTPDLGTSAFGAALLAARSSGVALTLDAAEDVAALARILAATPRLGILRAGEGPADALITLARDSAPALGLAAPTLSGSVTFGSRRAVASGEHHVALPADAALALPLIITGLAQRFATARRSPSMEATREATPTEEPIPA